MASRKKTPKQNIKKAPPPQEAGTKPGIAFEINFDTPLERPQSAGPRRLRQQERKEITLTEVQEKQRKAEERRKAAEAEKLQKIQNREENCKKVTQKMEKVVNRLTLDDKTTGPVTTFDENEVVPALRNKMGDQHSGGAKKPSATRKQDVKASKATRAKVK